MTRTTWTLLFCALSASACKPKEAKPKDTAGGAPKVAELSKAEAESGDAPGFLTAGDLEAQSDLKAVSRTDAENVIKDESFKLKAIGEFQPDETDNCMTNVVGKVRATANAVWYSGNFDFLKCQESSAGLKYTAAAATMVLVIRCPGVDLSKHDGVSYEKIDVGICKGAKSIETLLHLKLVASLEAKGTKGWINGDVESIMAVSTADGKPCRKELNGDAMKALACTSIRKSRYTNMKNATAEDKEASKGSFELMRSSTMSGKAADEYYSTGKIDLVIGDWSGALVYQGGDEKPKWSLKSKDDEMHGTWPDGVAFVPSASGDMADTDTETSSSSNADSEEDLGLLLQGASSGSPGDPLGASLLSAGLLP